MSTCISCGRKVSPGEKAVKMSCPNCGAVTIWRCEKCRLFGRNYRCPACGFQGP
ncbi:MAG: zinc finger domain-containing protein [Candidatus Bathyarchaeota archaeon]|nr:zinc finger domain-containing protein [Candidatus Bathyarchaeota archaeon]